VKPVVIKLGGSLLGTAALAGWLDNILSHGPGRVVIVPGGGWFAERVRIAQAEQGFGDDTAHRQAIEAMQGFADELINLAPRLKPARSIHEVRSHLDDGNIPVAVVMNDWLQAEDIRASWDWTSDSLALWLARALEADAMLLVKQRTPDRDRQDVSTAVADNILDKAFPDLLAGVSLPVSWCGADQAELLATWVEAPESVYCRLISSASSFN